MFPKGLIVSSQALEGNPLRNSEYLAVMAEAALKGCAKAIRANGIPDITEIRKRVSVPIIGIDKRKDETGHTIITPDIDGVAGIIKAGADIIALDATVQKSSIKGDPYELIRKIHEKFGVQVMADISTLEEAKMASEAGADAVSTTLSGYVPGALYAPENKYVPDFSLLKAILDARLSAKLVAEGRFWRIEDVKKAFDMGIHAMVIGKAITNPMAITTYFNSVIEGEVR